MGSTNNNDNNPEVETDFQLLLNILEDGTLTPQELAKMLLPNITFSPTLDDMTLLRLTAREICPPRRIKLSEYNTIDDAVDLIRRSKNIMVLTGAGISTSAGIPDFRSSNGIYDRIHQEFPELADPKMMFDLEFFKRNPKPFFQFAKALFPGSFKPTVAHKFIKAIEKRNCLLRNYTQNIDTLERQAGIQRVIECHGSFARATCIKCGYQCDGADLKDDIMAQKIPLCPTCPQVDEQQPNVMKPNIVFFSEKLPDAFHDKHPKDLGRADLLIVIGSSLKVSPVARMPRLIHNNVPQILINLEHLDHVVFDIELLGDCNDTIKDLCARLGEDWQSDIAED